MKRNLSFENYGSVLLRFACVAMMAGFFFVLPVRTAGAATINVPADYATIQAAIDGAAAGDTVQVAAGTYVGNLVIGKSLSLLGAGSASTTVKLAGPSSGIYVGASDVTIQGLLLEPDSLANKADFNIVFYDAPALPVMSNLVLRDVKSYYSAATNVLFHGGGTFSNVTIVDCDISHGGNRNLYQSPDTTINGLTVTNSHFDYAPQSAGGDLFSFNLQGFTTDLLIDGCTFNENPDGGMSIRGVTAGTIQNSTVFHSGFTTLKTRPGIQIYEDVGTTSGIAFHNMTVTNCGGVGILIAADAKTVSDVTISGATITGSKKYGIHLYSIGVGGSLSDISVTGGTRITSNDANIDSKNYYAEAKTGASIVGPMIRDSSFSVEKKTNITFTSNVGGPITGATVTNNDIIGLAYTPPQQQWCFCSKWGEQ